MRPANTSVKHNDAMNIPQLEEQLVLAKSHLTQILEAGRKSDKFKESLVAFEAVASAQRNLAAAKGEEYAKPHNIGFVPEAAVPEPVLLQTEYAAVITFCAVRQNQDGKRVEAGYGIVDLDLCSTTKFGYPNDEALSGHPLYQKGLRAYGVFEVLNSNWIRLKTEQNRVAFPNTPESTQRHFIFTFHDSTFECIAHGLRATLNTKPYAEIFEEVRQRVFKI